MYADRIATTGRKRSVKDRLGLNNDDSSTYAVQSSAKRQRGSGGAEEKWKHDLYEEEEEGELPRAANGQGQDLRAKLQQKHPFKSSSANDSRAGVRDLREKLSGPSQTRSSSAEGSKRVPLPVKTGSSSKNPTTSKPAAASPTPAAPTVPSKALQKPVPKKSSQVTDYVNLQDEEKAVANLLHSLGLGKYLITFQAEEVDMAALKHMTDDDLRAIGIPMGPRKKILLALDPQGKR